MCVCVCVCGVVVCAVYKIKQHKKKETRAVVACFLKEVVNRIALRFSTDALKGPKHRVEPLRKRKKKTESGYEENVEGGKKKKKVTCLLRPLLNCLSLLLLCFVFMGISREAEKKKKEKLEEGGKERIIEEEKKKRSVACDE